jgi:RecJ-like exonuclease
MSHEVEVQRPCPHCHGGGISGIVSPEMAADAGEPGMAGMEVPCSTCGGQGWVPDVEIVDD